MTEDANAERAHYFQDFSRRAIDRAAELCPPAGNAVAVADACHNPCGLDLDQADLELIDAVVAGHCDGVSAWRQAQVLELGFWRWVALRGYLGMDPRLFPLHVEHLMVTTFYRTGWTMNEFRHTGIFELGCGPLGMIEYLPAARRVGFDPLNDKYSRLFANFRTGIVEYVSDPDQFAADRDLFELGICHNVVDHTDDAAAWFNILFAKIKMGGRFIFQVNLTKEGTPQSPEHRRMHPSPLTVEQVTGWLAAKSAEFDHFCEAKPSSEGEFYFLSWGTKTCDEPLPQAARLARS